MRFGIQHKEKLMKELLKLYTELFLEAKEKQDIDMMAEESTWFKKVYEANLVTDPKQLFLLGALAKDIHDLGPKAIHTTMEAMGILKKES